MLGTLQTVARRIRIQLLGGFAVEVDGVSVGVDAFERRSGANLVQLLALADQSRLHREQVIDRLWPDAALDAGANRLHKAATFARKALGGPDVVVLRQDVVALCPDGTVEVDTAMIDAATLDDQASVIAAVAAYRGDLLPDEPYADWIADHRERLRARHLAHLRHLGRWTEVVALDPADEEAHLALLREAAEAGDRALARRRFDALATGLADLGLEPGPEARGLVAGIDSEPDVVAEPSYAMRTFLMTDIEGSTRWWSAYPDDMRSALARHDELLNAALGADGGDVFKHTGDGMVAAFTSPAAAVRAALLAQAAIADEEWPGEVALAIRIGLDLGEAEHRDGDWFGPVVARTERVMSAGSGGQVVCTDAVADVAGADLGGGVEVDRVGSYRFSDLPPVRLCLLGDEAVPIRRAPLRADRAGGTPVAGTARPTVGRADEAETVRDLITTRRLVSLVGPGGAGKTHLARHVVSGLTARSARAMWMCELAPVADGGDVGHRLLAAVGGRQHADADVVESIVRTVEDDETLIVLDNCEHVIDGARSVVAAVLAACPGARVLATSREALGLDEEQVLAVGPLDRASARALFVAEAVRRGGSVDAEDPAVDAICARLDDLPLAVQLAAARAAALGVRAVSELLDDRLTLLADSTGDGPGHHATLRSAIAWSVDLLDDRSRPVLAALSAFAQRFDLDGARAVADDEAGSVDVIEAVSELQRQSLLVGPESVDGSSTYRLLESVRMFAREELDPGSAVDRHLAYTLARARETDARSNHDFDAAIVRYRADRDDVRTALDHAAASGRGEAVAGLLASVGRFVVSCLDFEFIDWCSRHLPPDRAETRDEARAIAGWASMHTNRSDPHAARPLVETLIEGWPEDPDVLWARAWIPWAESDLPEATRWLTQLAELPPGDAEMSRLGASCLLCIVRWAAGEPVDEHVLRLEVGAARGGSLYRAMAHIGRGIAHIWTDPDVARRETEAAMVLADADGLESLSVTTRSTRAVASAIWDPPEVALGAVEDALSYASDRACGRGRWRRSGRPPACSNSWAAPIER